MCGRYTLIESDKLQGRFSTINTIDQMKPNYNTAPGQIMPVVRDNNGNSQVELMKWGFVPVWAKEVSVGYKMINARIEGIDAKPSFRRAYKSQRCLIPANGYYEWHTDGGDKQPFYISLPKDELFSFAGLWESWKQANGEALVTYTIITMPSVGKLKDLHDRMPVILKKEVEQLWLDQSKTDPDELRAILNQNENQRLVAKEADKAVGNVKNNYPELLPK